MKFEEAIKINGKATIDGTSYVHFDDDDVLVDNNGVKQYLNKSYFVDDIWEQFEDKDWNLAEQENERDIDAYTTIENFKWNKDIKKCRDVILERITDPKDLRPVEAIIKATFGDLK